MPKPSSTWLWTRDFIIITLGSLVAMVGAAMSSFAISIMVPDYTGSTFLYVLFSVCYQLPCTHNTPCSSAGGVVIFSSDQATKLTEQVVGTILI